MCISPQAFYFYLFFFHSYYSMQSQCDVLMCSKQSHEGSSQGIRFGT